MTAADTLTTRQYETVLALRVALCVASLELRSGDSAVAGRLLRAERKLAELMRRRNTLGHTTC